MGTVYKENSCMRLIFVTNGLSSGGSERVLSLIAGKMAERGHQVEIIVLMKDDVFYEINPHIKLVFAEKESKSTSLLKKTIWLRSYIKRSKPDVVIAFLNRVYSLTILSLLGTGIPVISSERSDPRHFIALYKILIRLSLPFSKLHVVQTEWVKEYYPKFIQNKSVIIVNPVNEKVAKIKPVEKKDIIISVGRLDWQKNQLMLIDAFKKILDNYPSYELHIYGEGPLREMLQQHIDEQGLTQRIILKGRSKEILEKMNEARVFCLSSDFEGMSNAMMEAMCLGLPIVTTQVSGVKELIKEGVNGFVTPVKDTDAFAKALEKCVSDKTRMENMSKNNRQAAKLFDIEVIANQWEDLVNRVAER